MNLKLGANETVARTAGLATAADLDTFLGGGDLRR